MGAWHSSRSRLSTAVSALVIILLSTTAARTQNHPRKGSPFDGARLVDHAQGAGIQVLVDGTWYEPLAINETAVEDILSFCAHRWPEVDPRRRFLQDLVEALALMGREPEQAVDLRVRTLADAGPVREVLLTDVSLSRSKRQNFAGAQWSRLVGGLVDRVGGPQLIKTHLPTEAVIADLEFFQHGLEERFAYLRWKGVDLRREVETLRADCAGATTERGVPIVWLHDRLERLLLRFGDGHSGVDAPPASKPSRGFAPYLLVAASGGVAAVLPDRSALVDNAHPYVVEINGEPLAAWLERVKPQVADGSPQLVLERSLRLLPQVRGEFGLPEQPSVALGLGSTPVRVDRVVELALVQRPPTYGPWPRRETQTLDGNVGYLRIPRMTEETDAIREAMDSFRSTRGLIIDVRGNGGGSRHALLAIAAYLQGPDEPHWVGNVATYKRAVDRNEDHLASRFVYRRDDPRFDDGQRAVIDSFRSTFEPEWKPEDPVGDRFSEWHYLVLGRTGDEREYFYDRPVVVLSDAVSFSATDIFLGALRGRPRVTLLCQDSGGGSARSRSFELPHSGLRVTAASMASFQPNGLLYDGRGVKVDVEVPQPPTDFLLGGTDHCLDEALRRLQ